MNTFKCLNCGNDQLVRGTTNFKNKYCDNKCQQAFQNKERVRQWLTEEKIWSGLGIPKWVKAELANRFGYKCSVCGIHEHNGKPLGLECDHIDGDPNNNRIENLRLICPNCHSQTETFKARNKGRGRANRYNNAPVAQLARARH